MAKMFRKSKAPTEDEAPVDLPNEWASAADGSGPIMMIGRVATPNPPPQPSYIGPVAAMLLCCAPLGIVSLVYAVQVPSRWKRGDEAGARHAAERAEFWMYASVGAQVLVNIVAVAYWFFSYRHRVTY